MYLFYVYALIHAKVLQHTPELDVSGSFEQYLITMEYGLVMLVAADMLIKQIKADHERIRQIDVLEHSNDENPTDK